jgi:hypothetical protein
MTDDMHSGDMHGDEMHGDDEQPEGTDSGRASEDRTDDPGDIGRTAERPLPSEVPDVPGEDLGLRGTKDVDAPPNTGELPPSNDLSQDPVTPEPPG